MSKAPSDWNTLPGTTAERSSVPVGWWEGWRTVEAVRRKYPLRYVSLLPYFPAPNDFVYVKKGHGKFVLTPVRLAIIQMHRWKMATMRKRRVTAAVTPVSE